MLTAGTTLEQADDSVRRAVGVAFVVNGFAMASWLGRLPELRQALGLTPGGVGLLLLCLSIGAVAALAGSGPVVARLGTARAVQLGALLVAAGVVGMALGVHQRLVPVVGAAMLAYGVGTSMWDVAMNVEAADVERRLARSVMPRFHAGWSIGSVLGAALGTVAARIGLPLSVQLVGTGLLVLASVPLVVRRFRPHEPTPASRAAGSLRRAWSEPRTLAIGVVVFGFALSEGIANDWVALALVDGYAAPTSVGTAGFAVFVTAMTVGRLFGGSATDRLGRVLVLRVTALLVIAGVAAVVLSPSLGGALAGAVLWGLGASLGFPAGMTAAGDDQQHSALRVSVVASVGYTAFLAGPPLVGTIADHVGIQDALWVAAGAAVLGLLAAPAVARQPTPEEAPAA